ncbi:MAG TPA: hypothetical protein VND87_06390 [Stellaceae bacterium]|nr:hypothetical protein [Stellaceae bacterium]
MTKLLDEAIARVRCLPEAEQDEAAEVLLALAARPKRPVKLDEATRVAVRQGLTEARHGAFADDREIDRLFADRLE